MPGVQATYAYLSRMGWLPAAPLGATSTVIRVWMPPENLPITLMYARWTENWFWLPAPALSFSWYRYWAYPTPLTLT